jgi:hypothetical protein
MPDLAAAQVAFLVSARKNFWKMSKCADGKRQHYEAAKFSGPTTDNNQ